MKKLQCNKSLIEKKLSKQRIWIKRIFALSLFLLIFLYAYRINTSYSSLTYLNKLRSYEYSGSSSNQGYIYIISYSYELPVDITLKEGTYIIYYSPEWEYNFHHWSLDNIEFAPSKDKYDNPPMIVISDSGEIRAYYLKGPQIDISLISPSDNSLFTDSPIDLKVKVTSNDKPVINARTTFYINSKVIGSVETDSNGCASISFEPKEEKIYQWYITAKKRGFQTCSSNEWKFGFEKIALNPSINEMITELPVNLVALVELDQKPVENVVVSFFFDDNHLGDEKTQSNGYATFTIRDISIGSHTWYVSVKIPRWNLITSETYNFTYIPKLSATLQYPLNNEVIVEYTSTIRLRAFITSGNKPLQEGNVSFYINGNNIGANLSDVDGIATFHFSPPIEGKTYDWYITVSKTDFINDTSSTSSFFYPIQPPYIEVDEVFTSTSRADVNSEQKIGFHIKWENGSDVKGAAIRINDNYKGTTNSSGWAYFNVSSSIIGEKVWKIIDVSSEEIGEFRQNKYPKIIWDRVSIELSLKKNRVNIGSKIEPVVHAFYEYDKTNFYGSIIYNQELYSNKVCDKRITVRSIQDNKYGLSAFKCNEVTLIWDRVKLSLEIRRARVQVGSEAEIICSGVYEYDQKPFKGSVIFDDNLMQNILSEKNFGVSSISDPLYSLSNFTFNQVSCIFDGIKIEQYINTQIPTQIKIITILHYSFDNEPVENAQVKVNGVGKKIGNCEYQSIIISMSPFLKIKTEIKLEAFECKIKERKILSISNIIFEIGIVTTFILIYYFQKRSVHLWESYLDMLEKLLNEKKYIEIKKASLILNKNVNIIKKLFIDLVKKKIIKGFFIRNEKYMILEEELISKLKKLESLSVINVSIKLEISKKEAEDIINRFNKANRI